MSKHINYGRPWWEVMKEVSEENTRLKAEVERLDTLCKQLGKQHSDISCENIMLRKAGDAMADEIIGCYNAEGYDPADSETLPKWNAAKEGKPSV